jgi:hypothetical protein
VQVTLQPSPAVQVLGSAKSNAQGLALLSEVKLRATPGVYTLAVASTTDKDVPPALVSAAAVLRYTSVLLVLRDAALYGKWRMLFGS